MSDNDKPVLHPITLSLLAFCDGVRPIVYTNYAFYRDYLQRHLQGYPLWIAYYGFRTPQIEPSWHFWQYSDRGSMAGISANVDVNVFHGSLEELDQICVP